MFPNLKCPQVNYYVKIYSIKIMLKAYQFYLEMKLKYKFFEKGMRIMFCSNCGTKVDNMSKFCPNCGNELILNNSNKNSRQQYENEFNRYPNSNIYTGNHQRNPWELYIDGWKNIFNYQGLSSRRGFWWFYLFYLISIVILEFFLVAVYAQETFLDQLLLAVLYLPLISISARRMRDVSKSIYWGVIPLSIQWFAQPYMVGDNVSTSIQALLLPFAIVFIVFACQDTKTTENRIRTS